MTSAKPNILFLHVDQLCLDTIAAYGCRWVKTPNIDRIIADGTSFLWSYATNPICCSARASWYTGLMSTEHGVVRNGFPLPEDVPDLGQWMRERGYRCYYAGKWHIPKRKVYRSFSMLANGPRYGEVGDAVTASASCGFLERYRGDEPFFLSVGLLNPHDCCYLTFAPKDPATKFELLDTFGDNLPPPPAGYRPEASFHTNEGPDRWDEMGVRLYSYYYFRMIEQVDVEVGRVYDALRRSQHAGNTLLLFGSDHGEMRGNQNRFKKGCLFEPAVKVPLAAVWPGRIKAGVTDDEHLVSGIDVTATILDAAGLDAMPRMRHASSLLPLMSDGAAKWRKYLVAENHVAGKRRAVITKTGKTVIYNDGRRRRYYDFKADPNELTDVAKKAKNADIVKAAIKAHNGFVREMSIHPDFRDWGEV